MKLGGSSHYKVVKWRFPNTKKCPIKYCEDVFKTKLLAFKHFKEEHAPLAVLCQFCTQPVHVKSFKEHTRMHIINNDDDDDKPPEKQKVVSCIEIQINFRFQLKNYSGLL